MNNINLIAFGTFGNPNGFKQTFFDGNRDLSKVISTFDLNTNAIKLFPGSSIYSIRKELAKGVNAISYSQYSFAKEQNSERSGTFIGSSVLFTNKISEEGITLSILNEFQETLINRNVTNDVISVNHSDALLVSKPKDLDKVNFNLREISGINFSRTSNKYLVVYCNTTPANLQLMFSKSLDLLNVYDTIYFTQSPEVAEFVAQKGIFKLAQTKDFENEINNLIEERRKKTESSINEFEKEIIRLDEDKNKMLIDFFAQIDQNEKIHKENERKILESKTDLETIKRIYNDFSQKIKELSNQLRSGRKYDDVKYLYEENKRIFIASIDQVKRPNFTNNIPKVKGKTELRQNTFTPQQQTRENKERENPRREHREYRSSHLEEPRLDIYKLTTFILVAVIVLSTIAFFIFSGSQDDPIIQDSQNSENKIEESIANQGSHSEEIDHKDAEHIQPSSTVDTKKELNPKSNAELAQIDVEMLSKKLKYKTPLIEVVQLIYNSNPTDVKSKYLGQEDLYGIQLVNSNKNCFEEKKGIYYFVHDTLKHLPCYKQ